MKNKTFLIYGRLNLGVSIEITATDFEHAIQESKDVKPTDFVKILGEYNDGEVEIEGIYKK